MLPFWTAAANNALSVCLYWKQIHPNFHKTYIFVTLGTSFCPSSSFLKLNNLNSGQLLLNFSHSALVLRALCDCSMMSCGLSRPHGGMMHKPEEADVVWCHDTPVRTNKHSEKLTVVSFLLYSTTMTSKMFADYIVNNTYTFLLCIINDNITVKCIWN